MRHHTAPRFVLTLLALFAALSAPATAVAHGFAHAHEHEHEVVAQGSARSDAAEYHVPLAMAPDTDADHLVLHRVAATPKLERTLVAAPTARYAHRDVPTTLTRRPIFASAAAIQHPSPHVPCATQPRAPPLG